MHAPVHPLTHPLTHPPHSRYTAGTQPVHRRYTAVHQVFKELSYLALSMTSGVSPATVGRVKHKYNLDTPLPNAQRTLARNNAVAQQARDWVIRFMPKKDRQLPKVEQHL